MRKLTVFGMVCMGVGVCCLVSQAATLNGIRINNDTSGIHTIGTKVTITGDTNVNTGSLVASNLTASAMVGTDSGKKQTSSTLTVTEANALHALGAASSQANLTLVSNLVVLVQAGLATTSNSLGVILVCFNGTNLTVGDLVANTITVNSSDPGGIIFGGSDTNHTITVTNTSDHLIVQGSIITPINTVSASDIDWSQSNTHYKSISGNTTFTFSNAYAGQWITVKVTAAAGNSVTFPTTTWKAGSTPTQTSSKTDFYKFFYDGTTYYGEAIQNF